jgi:hypothetical protein
MLAQKFLKEKDLILVSTFQVYYSGWECDHIWYLCRNSGGKKVVVATNHGVPYIAQRQVVKQKCEEYRKALQETEAILAQI